MRGGWLAVRLALALAACSTAAQDEPIDDLAAALDGYKGEPPPEQTPRPADKICPDGTLPSPPNRSIRCPFSQQSKPVGDWEKTCDKPGEASERVYTIRCTGMCEYQTKTVITGDEKYFPYCVPGGEGVPPYLRGCEDLPQEGNIAGRQQVSKIGPNYPTMEKCKAALPAYDCGSLAEECKKLDADKDVAWIDGANGVCCDPQLNPDPEPVP
jgi:hypothetical protein